MTDKKIRNMLELAAASGISRPTLSKYFADPSRVRPATRERIEQALKDFDYRPNFFAINQNRRKPKNIGVIVPYIGDPFYAEIVRLIEARCSDEGYWAIVLSSHGDPDLEARAVETLLSLKLAAAIVVPLAQDSSNPLLSSLGQSVPLVLLDAQLDVGLPFVGNDNRQSIALMVDYLCRTGEPPCFLAMPAVNRSALARREAYIETMQRLGHEPRVIEPDTHSWEFEALAFAQAQQLLTSQGFPSSSVLCANDRLAFGVIAAAYQQGVRVGRTDACELRVAGHDDHPLSRYTCPPLTTVAQDFAGIARRAMDLLLSMVDAQDEPDMPALIQLEARLVMRDSA